MVAKKECISHGPWGGSHGEEWVYLPEGFIRKISVRHGGGVLDSIQFETFNSIGETQSSSFGRIGSNRPKSICIDYPEEYLISISGTLNYYQGLKVINSICFTTNEKQYGPYGAQGGTVFSYGGKGGMIVGFHGRVEKYLTSIGIFVMPKALAFSQISTYQGKFMDELSSSMNRMALPRNTGPWGVSRGTPWDDGVFSIVKKVHVHVREPIAYAIQFEYLKRDGKLVLSPIRGQTGASRIEVINLDGKDEYLTGISGFYGPLEWLDGVEAIKSISFHTNKMKYGPYGEEKGTGTQWFTSISKTSLGKVVGFHGWSDGFLTNIGVHMEYF